MAKKNYCQGWEWTKKEFFTILTNFIYFLYSPVTHQQVYVVDTHTVDDGMQFHDPREGDRGKLKRTQKSNLPMEIGGIYRNEIDELGGNGLVLNRKTPMRIENGGGKKVRNPR